MKIDFLKGIKGETLDKTVIVRMSSRTLLKLKVNAMMFADGNVSEWVRYSTTMLLPPAHHIDASKPPPPEEWRPDCTITAQQLEEIARELELIEKKEIAKDGSSDKVSRVTPNGSKRSNRVSRRSKKPK